MRNERPPDRTIRYRIKTNNLPAELSNVFFSQTQVPHTKCFKSGPYIIVGVASEADRDKHTTSAATGKLQALGFELVESQDQISAKTILARRVDDYILQMSVETLRDEIEDKNNIKIADIKIIPKAHMIKLRLNNKQEAENTKKRKIRKEKKEKEMKIIK